MNILGRDVEVCEIIGCNNPTRQNVKIIVNNNNYISSVCSLSSIKIFSSNFAFEIMLD